MDFATFRRQVEIAGEEDARGFLAGRAIWQEGTRRADPADRQRFLKTIAVSRLRIRADIANYRGTPWIECVAPEALPPVQEGWHTAYEETHHAGKATA